MRSFLNNVRQPNTKQAFSKQVLHSFLFLLFGLLLGYASKWFDLYVQFLGEVFSQMSVWIFLGTVISVYSHTPKRASVNVFLFCAGMLLTYYLASYLMQSYLPVTFLAGWCIFTLLTPVLAFFAWYATGNGWFAKAICWGILICIPLCAIVLFDHIRISDVLLFAATALVLFRRMPNGRATRRKKT